MNNPKLISSNLIDCIPILEKCPNNCKPCYYNDEGLYRNQNITDMLEMGDDDPKSIPIDRYIPSLQEVENKIVRVNSGGDSSIKMNYVLSVTKQYPKKFYNTSLPFYLTKFPAPVVFTCNPHQDEGWFYAVSHAKNLMFVRIRVDTWNVDTINRAVTYYANAGVPVVLTFLYFNESNKGTIQHPENYYTHKHVENDRIIIKPNVWDSIMNRYPFHNVLSCGSPESALCADCGNCELLYERAMSIWYK